MYTETAESKAFYIKMKADYKRYMVEITFGKDREDMSAEAKSLYEKANVQCETLFSTHPLRLATALNYSVFLAECCHELQQAIDCAKSAFEAALFDLQALGEDKMNEVLRAMQLLKDNYTLWEIDLKAILAKQKEAGHFIEGMESDDAERDFEEAHQNEQ